MILAPAKSSDVVPIQKLQGVYGAELEPKLNEAGLMVQEI